jgi:hypothetical protein
MRTKYLLLITFVLILSSCKKFLTKLPLDQLTDETYWTSEDNVRTFVWGFYDRKFIGNDNKDSYFTWGGNFSGGGINDDFAPFTPIPFVKNIPASDANWSFEFIRKANLIINRVNTTPMSDEAKRNWIGIGRFFRALEFSEKVNRYGDFPWYGDLVDAGDIQNLYKPRDSRTLVMDSILSDFKYAAENVRISDPTTGPKGLIVNKDVVLAFMSRIMLREGTWQKYHNGNQSKWEDYLKAAKWAANEIIVGGRYGISDDFRKLFNSLDLSNNSEIILYRRYESGLFTHNLMTYVNREAQIGVSKNIIESYLCSDGLPISISPIYHGDKNIVNVMTDRDPRLSSTFVNKIRLVGVDNNYSTTGYATKLFLNEEIMDQNEGNNNLNPTDAPIIRLGEVLLNYAEACAELGEVTQNDLDISINQLRNRASVQLPKLVVVGQNPSVNGVVYDDPKRDPMVSPILWEIRRERRVELIMQEGFRNDDLRRWGKLEYTDTKSNPDINRGAWLRKSDYPASMTAEIENNANEGYIIPAPALETMRVFDNPRVYLYPVPLDQITLYKDNGVILTQNPGWQ